MIVNLISSIILNRELGEKSKEMIENPTSSIRMTPDSTVVRQSVLVLQLGKCSEAKKKTVKS